MVIHPGDLIIGDGDGVLCVPFDEIDQILTAAEAKKAAEDVEMAAIRAGSTNRSWVDQVLAARGCEIES